MASNNTVSIPPSSSTTPSTSITPTNPPTTESSSQSPPPVTSTTEPTTSTTAPTTTATTTTPSPTTTTPSPSPTTTSTTTPSPSSSTPSPTTDTTVTETPTPRTETRTETQTIPPSPTTTSSSSTSSSSSPSATILAGNGGNGSGGLEPAGKIAIAVIIPVVVVALLLVLGFFLWRKRKATKAAEEQRKDEMAEYGFNPNNEPSLFPAGAAGYADGHSDVADDNSGYRGWGTTNSNVRKPSTTLGSNSRGGAKGMGPSENGSQPGGYSYQPAPTNGVPEPYSDYPATNHPETADGVTALGAAAATKGNRNSQAEIHRGVSNASSSYSRGPPLSDSSAVSADVPYHSPTYHEDAPYIAYSDGQATQGGFNNGTYGDDQPVIRDVSARRNTKIERAPTFPQTQGGISQNF